MVELFTHEEAQELLFTFAGSWPVLERAPGAIVIDDVASLDSTRASVDFAHAYQRERRTAMYRSSHAVSGSAMCRPCRSPASHSARSALVNTVAPTKIAAARWTAS